MKSTPSITTTTTATPTVDAMQRSRLRRRRGIAVAVTLVPLLLGGLSACSSADDTSADGSTESAVATAHDWDLAYASCMRSKAIDYPDPVAGESGGPQQVDDASAFEEAARTCKKKVIASRGEKPVSDADRKQHAEWEKGYADAADCLRKKGYEVTTIEGGGWSATDRVPDADLAACQSDELSHDAGGAK